MALIQKRQSEVENYIQFFKDNQVNGKELVETFLTKDFVNPKTKKKVTPYTETWICLAKALDYMFETPKFYQTAINEKHLTESGNPKRKSAVDSDMSSSGTDRSKASDENTGYFKYGKHTIKLTGDMKYVVKLLENLKMEGKVKFVGKKLPQRKHIQTAEMEDDISVSEHDNTDNEHEEMNNEETTEATYVKYLENLRDSGVTNMMAAPGYLQRAFPELTKNKAQEVFMKWARLF